MSEPLVGVIPLRDIARRWKCTHRCARRRLKAYDLKIGGGLLVQFGAEGDRTKYFADAAMLAKHLPGLLFEDPRDPVLRALEEVRDLVLEVRAAVT